MDQRDGASLSLQSRELSMFVKQKPDSKKMNKWINKLADNKNSISIIPGLAMLALIASGCFFFHFLISLRSWSFFSGFNDHRQPFLWDVPSGRSNLQNALLSDKLWRTEF